MRPGIGWGWSGSALIYFLVEVWRYSWGLRLMRLILVLECHFHPCIILASIFFLDNPYRAVHPGFWFCTLPVGGWSAYSRNTNFGSCSLPFFFVLLHSSVFSKGNVVVAVSVSSVCETFYSLSVILGHGAGSVKSLTTSMRNTYCLFQIKFITEYTNVQQVIITQILLKQFNQSNINWECIYNREGASFLKRRSW